jgi:DNA-binding YbaB/EbfC family protein
MQQELEESEFEFTAGGGVVKAVVMGSRQVKSIEIDPEAVDPDDVEMLQDMIVAAVNGALKLCEEKSNASMAKLQSGISLPGLF